MTTKEAGQKFNISDKEIRQLCKKGFIVGARKECNKWIIPNDTSFIIDETGIIYILWEIINILINSHYLLSIKYIDTLEKARACFLYMQKQGYISYYDEQAINIAMLLKSVKIAQQGIEFLRSKNQNSNNVKICFCENFSLFNIKAFSVG